MIRRDGPAAHGGDACGTGADRAQLGCDRLRGTGSHDLVVDDVFVADEWTFVRGAPPTIDLAAYRYPSLALAAQVLAVVGLGVARASLDLMGRMAGKRGSITGAPVMAERANVQIALAKGESQWQATRAWFYEVTERTCAMIQAGETPSREQVAMIRMAAAQAARTGADVTRLMFEQAGTAGIFNSHPSRACCRMRWWSTSTPSSTRPSGKARAGSARARRARRFSLIFSKGTHHDRYSQAPARPVLRRCPAKLLRPARRRDRQGVDRHRRDAARHPRPAGVSVLGTLDDDETMVGTSPNGWPWTFYILADVPDRADGGGRLQPVPHDQRGEHRLWKYMRVEARIGRELVIPA
jgi:hypothetical protein